MKSGVGYLKYFWVILVSLLMTAFQNCSLSNSGLKASGNSSAKSIGVSSPVGTTYEVGGEEGYEGKPSTTYGGHSTAGQCSNGSEFETEVEVDTENNVAIYTRENCESVKGGRIVPLASLEILPHNKDNFKDGSQVFERIDDPTRAAGELFAYCRGFAKTGEVMVDAIFRRNAQNEYFGRIVSGKYDINGNLVATRDTGFEKVQRWESPNHPTFVYFNFFNEAGEREAHLGIKGDGAVDGSMQYWISPDDESWGNTWNFPCVRLMK